MSSIAASHLTQPAGRLLSSSRVLDLTGELGQLCGRFLSDLGADVLKVEPLGGDRARRQGPFYQDLPDLERGLPWLANNVGKRSITLNLESADGRALFRQLLAKADFLLESFRPGYLDGLELGFEVLHQINPRLVHTSITPFGQRGPYWDYVADDLVIMALGGLLISQGSPGETPGAHC